MIQLIHMYIKLVKVSKYALMKLIEFFLQQDGYSMQPSSDQLSVKFQLKYKATTAVNTDLKMEWHGEAFYVSNRDFSY